jgi:hypothetical protein
VLAVAIRLAILPVMIIKSAIAIQQSAAKERHIVSHAACGEAKFDAHLSHLLAQETAAAAAALWR